MKLLLTFFLIFFIPLSFAIGEFGVNPGKLDISFDNNSVVKEHIQIYNMDLSDVKFRIFTEPANEEIVIFSEQEVTINPKDVREISIDFIKQEKQELTIFIQQIPKNGATIVGGIKIPVTLQGNFKKSTVPIITGHVISDNKSNIGTLITSIVIISLIVLGGFAIWKVIKW